MASIVELRQMSQDKIEEMLENNREELFNLRFQKAAAGLEDTTRIRHVRRETAQLETVLNMRRLAKQTAASVPEIAAVLDGVSWKSTARFVYEDSAWHVNFTDLEGGALASALVDLNKPQPHGRKERASSKQAHPVVSYELAG